MIPYQKGVTPKQAHVGIPDGLFEEEYARNGFFGKYAHFYRTEPPVNWTDIEGPLKPRAYELEKINFESEDFISSRKAMFENADLKVLYLNLKSEMSYCFRNADGDEVYFIHEGSGKLDTDFGPMDYARGDYLVIPRGTVYRFFPSSPTRALLVESFSEIELPEKGMLGQHALFDPSVITVPEPLTDRKPEAGDYTMKIKRAGEITTVRYPYSPLNTVGWKGTLCAWKINVNDIRPVSCDRYHLPPSAHSTFVANNFVICTFLPRPLENGDPTAMKVPFYHSNIDFDELIFYHDGEFFSREGVEKEMITFHPQGIQHGPQPGAVERSIEARSTQEIAVMIDTKNPIFPTECSGGVEVEDYWKSWTVK